MQASAQEISRTEHTQPVDCGYLDDELWLSIHEEFEEGQVLLGFRNFLDDSGSDDVAPIATIGGPAMSRIDFRLFTEAWGKLLFQYRIPQPLHMVDFVRPQGRHIGIGYEMKFSLFSDIVKLINLRKLYSISIAVPQVDFR